MAGSVNKHILVCGAGSIGQRHIANLKQLGARVTVWRSQTHLLEKTGQEFAVAVNKDLDDAIDRADAVVVATSTDNHIPLALKVLGAGKAVFIEKPLSHNWSGIDEVKQLSLGKVVELGCQLRTHPNLIVLSRLLNELGADQVFTYRLAMGHRLDAWRQGVDYSRGYSADADRGGGALFDLIHQIDLALWLFGPIVEVNAVLSKRSGLHINADDVSNLLVTHKSGLTGHIQLDMASPVYRCEAEVMTSDSIFNWSYLEGTLYKHSQAGNSIEDQVPEGFERNNLFTTHMSRFLARLDDDSLLPLCSIDDGIAALRVAICSRESSMEGKKVTI